jgi:hypothetical protein
MKNKLDKRSVIMLLVIIITGLIGYWLGSKYGVEKEKSFLGPVDLKLLNSLSFAAPPKTPRRIADTTAKNYISLYRRAIRTAMIDGPSAKEFLGKLNRLNGWRINLDSLKTIETMPGKIAYVYFYPAFDTSDSTFTLITVGAEIKKRGGKPLKQPNGLDSTRLIYKKMNSRDRLPLATEIWDNMSPCPDNCPDDDF